MYDFDIFYVKSVLPQLICFFRETIYSAMREMQNSTNHNPHRNHQRSRNSTSSSSSGFNNIRNRTHSWSNVDKRSTSAKPISAHSRQSSAIIPDSRYRTTSEGNAHFDIKPRSIGKSRRKNYVKSVTYVFLFSITDFIKKILA